MLNSNVEEGYLWQRNWDSQTSVSADTTHRFAWSEEKSVSPTHSLKISASSMPSTGVFGYWTQIVGVPPGQYAGMTLRLSASIMLDEVMGQGVSILVTAYDDSMNMVGAAGTQGDEVIRGTHYWRKYSVRLTSLSEDARTLYVYLIFLSGAQGTVYFDDITLTVLKKG